MSYPLSFHHYSLGQVRLGGIGGSGASWGWEVKMELMITL